MNVAFVNENTLGHASYLLPFVRELKKRPELGITPHVIDATPLPAPLAARAHFSIRGLRRWGLDFQRTRWRVVVSRYVRDQVEILKSKGMLDAVVVNTQSVALGLGDLARQVPVFVCLDATFSQLCESAWFAPNRASRFLLPFTTSGLLKQERAILNAATGLFAWSESVRKSLIKDYHCPPERIGLMPPSTDLHRGERAKSVTSRRQILFIGGDFDRKGGRLLLECYRKWFSHDCDLQVVTQTRLPAEPGVYVHHSVLPYTADWYARWQSADVFVFPSTLETFGIVLVEALALGIPVIATDVGAVRFCPRRGSGVHIG